MESSGSNEGGPSGVKVELKSKSEVRTTTTDENGRFFFTPVYPGTYTVSISHEKYYNSLNVLLILPFFLFLKIIDGKY